MRKLLLFLLLTSITIHAEVRTIQQLEPIETTFENCSQNTIALFNAEQMNHFSSVITLAKEKGIWLIALSKDLCAEDLTKFDQLIQTDTFSYGPLLEEYFETLTIYPSQVIFADTREDHVQSVYAICARRNIACIAFYLANS